MKRNFLKLYLLAAGAAALFTGCAGSTGESANASKETGAMGRYVETCLVAPGDHGSIGLLGELADGNIAFLDNVDGLFISDDNGADFERSGEQMEILQTAREGDKMAVSPDGRIVYAKKKEDGGFSLQARNAEGGVQIYLEEKGNLLQLIFGPDKMLYAAVYQGGAYDLLRIDTAEWTVQRWVQPAKEPVSIAFLGGRVLVAEADRVEQFAISSGQLLEEDPVLSEFAKSHLKDTYQPVNGSAFYLFAGKDEVLYAACREGLYRHVAGGNLMEQLIDGKSSWFGRTEAAVQGMLEISEQEFLALFAGGNLIRFSYDDTVPAKPEATLKVYSLYKDRNVQQAVELFEKDHPKVRVTYETGMTADSLEALAGSLEQIRERIPEGTPLETYGPEWTLRLLAYNSAQTWISDKELDKETLTEFLTQAERIYEAEADGVTAEERQQKEAEERKVYRSGFAAGNGSYRYPIAEWSLYPALKGEMFFNREGMSMGLLRGVEDFINTAGFINLQPEYEMKLMPGQAGKNLLGTQQLAVSSQSGQKELAFAFAASVFEEKTQKLWSQNEFPVNLSVLREQLESEGTNSAGGLSGLNWQGQEVSLAFSMPGEKVREAFLAEIQDAACAQWPRDVLLDTVVEYGQQVLEGKKSAAQGVDEIEKKLAIYLAE